eukprot:gnl/Chilomastix_caulleri/377.p1 GENE.gnl/Chilomastix_caulleri/377~~gnl/Chilomastix_caulleri/377.p1  ORF type:complete len:113 (+),score=26.27 gnl/Chilomastix_caulleri/377:55-393(+)
MAFHYPHSDVHANPVTDYGSHDVTIKVLIQPEKAPHFIMRRFDIEPGGVIGVHQHPHEHQMYILDGEMFLIDSKGKHEKLQKDEFVFMPGNEEHGYVNEGTVPCSFICMVPK